MSVLQIPQQLPLFACPIQIQLHNLNSMDFDYIQFGIFDCKTSVYILLFIGNIYFPFVALDPFLLVVSIFIIEWRDTELRSRINEITGSQTVARFLEIICKYCIRIYKKVYGWFWNLKQEDG